MNSSEGREWGVGPVVVGFRIFWAAHLLQNKPAPDFFQKLSGDPNPSIFPKVLPYKWGAYCSTNGRRIAGFPVEVSWKLRSQESAAIQMGGRTAIQIGGALPYFLDKL